MRYLCTIYTHDDTFAGKQGFTGTEPSSRAPLARVVVPGSSLREAAARAYVRCVGRPRALALRQKAAAPEPIIALETSRKAIAASLRKVTRRFGEVYEMDNYFEAWSIKVEPAPITRQPRRQRLPHLLLCHLCRLASPN